MNIIQQAAEDYRKNTKYVQGIGTIEQLQKIQDNQYHSIVDHWHSYLSQQGDEDIVNVLSTWHNGYNIQEKIQQALAIGRTMNRWIPVSERLPEEKDAGYICGNMCVETLHWNDEFKCWDVDYYPVENINLNSLHYWRTPSQYPEPPKTEL